MDANSFSANGGNASNGDIPPFQPHALLKNPHAQTIAAVYLPGSRYPYRATQHRVAVDQYDQIVLHDDCPPEWRPGMRTVLLVHGLGGCHLSAYMVRIAAKLNQHGLRTFRMDQRGCGAGLALARRPFHGGRYEDVAAALEHIAALAPGSPTTLVGFSIGGNVSLMLLGKLGHGRCGELDNAIIVCPPIDLEMSSRAVEHPSNRVYANNILSALTGFHRRRCELVPRAVAIPLARRPATLRELDNIFVAPIWGFGDAANYYRQCSSRRIIQDIRMPTRIVAARDDPLVPVSQFADIALPRAVQLHLTRFGGHLGYVGRAGRDPDRRWLDWRIVRWVQGDAGQRTSSAPLHSAIG